MSLEVLMLAAAKPGGGRITHRLPAVYDSFLDWVEQTCKDFRLQKQIDEVLAQRKYKNRLTMTWGDWRRKSGSALGPMLKERFGFKDNKRKPDNEELTLEVEECINWQPGGDMSGVDLIRTARDLPDLVTELSDEIIAEWIATAPHGLFVDDPTKQKGPD